MADYAVMIQNEEGNDEALSITGLVNGRQVSAVIRKSRMPQGKTKKSLADQAEYKANAMVDAYLAMPGQQPSAAAHMVTRE